jgi:hypothetical protein
MRTESEIREVLAERVAWLEENEDSGAAEVGQELGWEQALKWVLNDAG